LPGTQIIIDSALEKVFPGRIFFGAFGSAGGMRISRAAIFVIKSDELEDVSINIKKLSSAEDLKRFFKQHLQAIKEDSDARDAVRAWLACDAILHSVRIKLVESSLKVEQADGTRRATGTAMASGAASGELGVVMSFDSAGKLTEVVEIYRLREEAPVRRRP
jgi:hypothetical protein